MSDKPVANVLELTAKIVAAHLSCSQTSAEALPALIEGVYRSLATAGDVTAAPAPDMQAPAVPIRKSVFPDHIVCLEDGKKLKMLKRHLQTGYGMTPDAYRAKWGLPSDYPMVAPNYARHRSMLAKSIGLGRKRVEEPVDPEPVVTQVRARRAKDPRG